MAFAGTPTVMLCQTGGFDRQEIAVTKVFLHVGMPKCASSSIQAHFADYYEEYCDLGLLYPKAGRETTGYRSHRPLHHATVEDFPKILTDISEEASLRNCHSILLSSEELANSRVQKSDTQALIQSIQSHFGAENVEILFLIRDHLTFIRSSFAQYLKGGLFRVNDKDFFSRDTPSIRTYADCFLEKNGFEVFSFSTFFQQFEAIANGARINLVSIKDPSGVPLLERICLLVGASFVGRETRRNESLSQHQLFCLLHARKRYGLNRVRKKRNLLVCGMIVDENFHSPLFDVDAFLVKRLCATAQQDSAFFKAKFQLDMPIQFPSDDNLVDAEGPVEAPENLIAFIDRVMTFRNLKMPRAKRIGKRMLAPTPTD